MEPQRYSRITGSLRRVSMDLRAVSSITVCAASCNSRGCISCATRRAAIGDFLESFLTHLLHVSSTLFRKVTQWYAQPTPCEGTVLSRTYRKVNAFSSKMFSFLFCSYWSDTHSSTHALLSSTANEQLSHSTAAGLELGYGGLSLYAFAAHWWVPASTIATLAYRSADTAFYSLSELPVFLRTR